MAEEQNFKEIVINSFKKAREDILKLENSLISLQKEFEAFKAQNPFQSSIGNEGVLSKQASKQASKQLNKQALAKQSEVIIDFNEDVEAHFKGLTKQEFLLFLSLYQLEDEMGPVTFLDLANYMKLSEGCVRAYVYRMLSRGSPIVKHKVNNRVVNLSLLPEFRNLNLKKRLLDIYYHLDTSQKRLFDPFNQYNHEKSI